MTDTTHNGYTNYETWATALWLDNDQGYHQRVRGIVSGARFGLSEFSSIRRFVEEELEDFVQSMLLTEDTPANLASDLLAHSLGRVNWREMAENYLAEED